MSSLAAALQPNTGVARDDAILELHSVLPIYSAVSRKRRLDRLQHRAVGIPHVSGAEHHQVEAVGSDGLGIVDAARSLQLQVYLPAWPLDHRLHFLQRHDSVRPGALVGIAEALQVHDVVDVLDQLETHDGVVCGVVGVDLLFADVRGEGEEGLDAVGVKDLVYTASLG